MPRTNNHRTMILVISFAAFSLLLGLSTMLINSAVSQSFGSAAVPTFYSLGLLFTAAGSVSFSLGPRLTQSLASRRRAAVIVGALYLLTLIAVLYIDRGALLSVAALVCPFTYGFLGGLTYNCLATELRGGGHMGKTIGVGYLLAVLLQYFIQSFDPAKGIYLTLLALALVALLVKTLRFSEYYLGGEQDRNEKPEPKARRGLWYMAALVAMIALIAGIYDGMAAELHAGGAINLGGWTRLLAGVGGAVGGFLYDMKRRELLRQGYGKRMAPASGATPFSLSTRRRPAPP